MLGNNIRKIRKSRGFSINKLSKVSGVSLGYLSDLENNKSSNPTTDTLEKLANALEISLDEFFKEDVDTKDNENINEDKKYTTAKEVKDTLTTHDKNIDTIAAHLEGKNLTPQKIKLLEQYIDALFDDEDFDD